MTDEKELMSLILQVMEIGGNVNVTYEENEGCMLIDTVQINNVKGCGPYPMSPIAAAEKMREIVYNYSHNIKKRKSFCA